MHRAEALFVPGAFVAAPVGGLLWGFGAFGLRVGYQWVVAKIKGTRFDAFDPPPPHATPAVVSQDRPESDDDSTIHGNGNAVSRKGRFF